MTLIFGVDDFHFQNGLSPEAADLAALIANNKINKLIEAAPVVYSEAVQVPFFKAWHNVSFQEATHSAKLMFITELPKKECEHEPVWGVHLSFRENIASCKHCGIELKPNWTPA